MGFRNAVLTRPQRWVRRGLFAVCVLGLASCGATYNNHGYFPPPEDLEQIVVGIDTRASVEETLGAAGAGSVINDDAMYFVRSRVRTFGLFEPEVVERQVLAISFDDTGVVSNLETFGLERGQVVPITRRVTNSGVDDLSFLRRLLGNIGQIGPNIGGGSGFGS